MIVAGAVLVVVVAAAAGLVYWLIVVTEGAYLGPRAVRLIYDWGAPTYDGVKCFDRLEEYMLLGRPLLDRLEATSGPEAHVLDIATGTARLPIALAGIPFYEGSVVGVDSSLEMLRQAAAKTGSMADRVHLLHNAAYPLPFADASFSGVTILEALEFFPDRAAALAEATRVLRPGGWLLITNRIGRDAKLMPGRTEPTALIAARLERHGFTEVSVWPWQSYYDLVWARNQGGETARLALGSRPDYGAWHAGLVCPGCASVGRWSPPHRDVAGPAVSQIECTFCGYVVGRHDGVWRL